MVALTSVIPGTSSVDECNQMLTMKLLPIHDAPTTNGQTMWASGRSGLRGKDDILFLNTTLDCSRHRQQLAPEPQR